MLGEAKLGGLASGLGDSTGFLSLITRLVMPHKLLKLSGLTFLI
jgi:hypothetical protein